MTTDGKVVPVRLALFAEMVKGQSVDAGGVAGGGGAEGVGVNFLEETFAAPTAPLDTGRTCRPSRSAPGPCTSPVRTSRADASRVELQTAAGYDAKPAEFDDLPPRPGSGIEARPPTEAATAEAGASYYQLTHVLRSCRRPPMADPQATRDVTGAVPKLRLADRAALWRASAARHHPPLGVGPGPGPGGFGEAEERQPLQNPDAGTVLRRRCAPPQCRRGRPAGVRPAPVTSRVACGSAIGGPSARGSRESVGSTTRPLGGRRLGRRDELQFLIQDVEQVVEFAPWSYRPRSEARPGTASPLRSEPGSCRRARSTPRTAGRCDRCANGASGRRTSPPGNSPPPPRPRPPPATPPASTLLPLTIRRTTPAERAPPCRRWSSPRRLGRGTGWSDVSDSAGRQPHARPKSAIPSGVPRVEQVHHAEF